MAGKHFKKPPLKGTAVAMETKDDLDLRDEILCLKKELTVVRKDRDKIAIRLRKTEEESKRKDRQIDQLMDPSQNSEIRDLMSMKGAAMLMNLKDQNNTLIHLIMEKNQQLKRMASELKTAKLYSKTSKNEPYRMEIVRLRNLLLKSQEALKEAARGPQVTCVSDNSRSSYASSEESSSYRELEELRFMVQSLETHMQYSKELLNKKNQEIATLSRELESVLETECGASLESCCKVSSQRKNSRRCASAPVLDRFQQDSLPKSSRLGLEGMFPLSPARQVSLLSFLQHEHHRKILDKNREEILKNGINGNDLLGDGLKNGPDLMSNPSGKTRQNKLGEVSRGVRQVNGKTLILAGKELDELEEAVLPETLTRGAVARRSKKSLAGKLGIRNVEKKRPAAREKWKCAFFKVHTSRKIPKRPRRSAGEKQQRKFHINPHANDDEVWAIIKEENFEFPDKEIFEEMENCLPETSVTNVAPPDDGLENVNFPPVDANQNFENEKPAESDLDNLVKETGALSLENVDKDCLPAEIVADRTDDVPRHFDDSYCRKLGKSTLTEMAAPEKDGATQYKLQHAVSSANQRRPQPKARKFSLPAKLPERESRVILEEKIEKTDSDGAQCVNRSEFNETHTEMTPRNLRSRFSIDSSIDSFEPGKPFQVEAEINEFALGNDFASHLPHELSEKNISDDSDDDDDVITI